MRTLKFALAAVAAFAMSNANAQTAKVVGLGNPAAPPVDVGTATPGTYQGTVIPGSGATDGYAFHAGGVAACDGCHVMHNATNGIAKSTNGGVAAWSGVTNAYLLQGSDQSSTCLICHSSGKTSAESGTGLQFTVYDTDGLPSNRTPGGDFRWIKQDFTNSLGKSHGHNVIAADFDLFDEAGKQAPGGAFTGGAGLKAFACSSCHDPHGRYRMQLDDTASNGVKFYGPGPGNILTAGTLPIAASGSYGTAPTASYAVGAYRLLGGQTYAPASNPGYPFPNDPPIAVAPQTYNKTEATEEVRVAYGTGMSEWCQNCHTTIHLDGYTSGVAGLRHPAGSDAKLHAGQIQVYNSYVSSGNVDLTKTSNYTSLVPFEQGKNKSLATLKSSAKPTSIIAADSDSTVMCLSCHRAHASAFDSMVRWDQNATFLTDGSANYTTGLTDATRTASITAEGYYDRPVSSSVTGITGTALGPYQRSLCNKCHGKD